MLRKVKQQLENTFSKELIDRLFESYQLAYEGYYRGKYRPCSLECGRFAEVALRMLQEITTSVYTPLGTSIPNFSNEVMEIQRTDKTKFPQSIRIQIPRTLQVIYDVRNKRDVGHVGGDIDANFSDSTLSLTSCSWVLTEFLRIYYTSDIKTAQELVNSLVKIKIPLIQDFNGFLKMLKPNLSLPKKIMAYLYYRASEGATVAELNQWLSHRIRKDNMDVTLRRLEHERAFIHRDNDHCYITDTGMEYVEENIPLQI